MKPESIGSGYRDGPDHVEVGLQPDFVLKPFSNEFILGDLKTGIAGSPLLPVPIIHSGGDFNDAPPGVGAVGASARWIGRYHLPDALMRTGLNQFGHLQSRG